MMKRNKPRLQSFRYLWTVSLSILTHSNALKTPSFPVLFDSSNHLHRDMQYHPEQAARIDYCLQAIDEYRRQEENQGGYLELVDVASDVKPIDNVAVTSYEPFSEEELNYAQQLLETVHTPELVQNLQTRCRDSRHRRIYDGKDPLGFIGYIDDDTYLTTESFDVCLRATASWIRAVDLAHNDHSAAAMALTRPPGHHATVDSSNGFCLFNFAAAAALHALKKIQTPDAKISILDWDVHYGQGVADIVEKHPQIRYASIHQTPAFPYLGEKRKVQGEFNNVMTIPMRAETTWTCGYRDYFESALEFLCQEGDWEPDVVIICAGYDALDSDELASVSLSAKDFGRMTTALLERVRSSQVHRGKRKVPLIFGLEGGYQLSPMAGGGNLPQAVLETIKALLLNEDIDASTQSI